MNIIREIIKLVELNKSQSGDLKVTCRDDKYTLDFPSRMPEKLEVLKEVEEALGVKVKELYSSRDLMAVVDNEETVRKLKPDFEKIKSLPIGEGVILSGRA